MQDILNFIQYQLWPLLVFGAEIGTYILDNPIHLVVATLIVAILLIVLRVVLKLSKFVVVAVLLLVVLFGGWGYVASVSSKLTTAVPDYRSALLLSEPVARESARLYATLESSLRDVSSVSAECPAERLPQETDSFSWGTHKLREAAEYCKHEVMFAYLEDDKRWLDIADQVHDTHVTYNVDVFAPILKAGQAVTVIHTHPAWLAERAPPSVLDLHSAVRLNEVSEVELRHSAVDSRGIWTYIVPPALINDTERWKSLLSSLKIQDERIVEEISRGTPDTQIIAEIMDEREQLLRDAGVELKYERLSTLL